jgi:ribonucleoside-diphosphate reductase beta chain
MKDTINHLSFFDPQGGPSIARYDHVKQTGILKIYEKMMSLFWRPEEIDLSRDKADFEKLTENQKQIFTETLLRAVLLDSIQGRSPNMMFLPIVSLPELEVCIVTWSFFESIHSAAYSYIIRTIYPNPDEVFNRIPHIEGIVACAEDISTYYDDLYKENVKRDAFEMGIISEYDEYEHKKKLWLALTAVNALEAVRFYSAFACFFNFAENGLMQGNASELKLIARDENLHVSITMQLINILPKEDPDFARIKDECELEVAKIYNDVVTQELEWVKFIFRDGGLLGLNEEMLGSYVRYIAFKKIKHFGVNMDFINFEPVKHDPLPWMKGYLDTSALQVAPQEMEQINYQTGIVDMNDLEGFSFKF